MALLGLAFDDINDPIVEAIGEGAYEIGGGDWQFGQLRIEDDVKNLFRLPVPLPNLSDALALFAEYLGWIPLDGLRQFRNLLPDVTDIDFSDVPTAVATIISKLTDKPLTDILLGFLREAVTGIIGATNELVQEFFGNFRDFLGIDFASGTFDIDVARETFVTHVIEPFLAGLAFVDQAVRDALTGIVNATPGDVDNWVLSILYDGSPLDALDLFNIVPPGVLGQLNISNIGKTIANLLTDPDFLDPTVIPGWVHDLTGGFGGTGSRSAIADGTLKQLFGNLIPVSEGQVMPLSGKVKWSGLLGTGSPIQLAVTGYNLAGNPIDQFLVASHNTSPLTTDWLDLAGTYTVPAGVEWVRSRLVVGSTATAGTVGFSKLSFTKSQSLFQNLISGTNPGETLVDDVQHLFSGILSNTVALLDKAGLADFQDLVEGIGGTVGSEIEDAIARVNTFLNSASPLNGSNITSGAIADKWVPGIGTLHDKVVTAVGNLAGGGYDATKVFEVLTGQTNALVSHGAGLTDVGARMSNLESRFAALPVSAGGSGTGKADGGVVGVLDTDGFERVSSSNLGSLWIPTYKGGNGTWATPNGHDATFIASGNVTREFLMLRNNPAILRSQTDYQRVTMELSSKATRDKDLLGLYDYCGANDIWLRVSDDTTSLNNITGIRIRYEGDGALSIYRFVSGAGVQLAGLGTGGITPPGPGAALIGETGVLADGAPRYFRALIGTSIRLAVQEVGTASGLGASFRRWGHGGRAQGASLLVGQAVPGGVHFWNGQDQVLE